MTTGEEVDAWSAVEFAFHQLQQKCMKPDDPFLYLPPAKENYLSQTEPNRFSTGPAGVVDNVIGSAHCHPSYLVYFKFGWNNIARVILYWLFGGPRWSGVNYEYYWFSLSHSLSFTNCVDLKLVYSDEHQACYIYHLPFGIPKKRDEDEEGKTNEETIEFIRNAMKREAMKNQIPKHLVDKPHSTSAIQGMTFQGKYLSNAELGQVLSKVNPILEKEIKEMEDIIKSKATPKEQSEFHRNAYMNDFVSIAKIFAKAAIKTFEEDLIKQGIKEVEKLEIKNFANSAEKLALMEFAKAVEKLSMTELLKPLEKLALTEYVKAVEKLVLTEGIKAVEKQAVKQFVEAVDKEAVKQGLKGIEKQAVKQGVKAVEKQAVKQGVKAVEKQAGKQIVKQGAKQLAKVGVKEGLKVVAAGNPVGIVGDVVQGGLEIAGYKKTGMAVGAAANVGGGAAVGLVVGGPLGAAVGAGIGGAVWGVGELVGLLF